MTNGSAQRTRMTRAESKENTRRLLIDAAERVFMRQGYQRATLDNVAADAGFTKGAIYSHFRSKEDLFVELLADGLKRNIDRLDQLASLGKDLARLDEELRRWIDEIGTRDNLPLLALEMELESRCNAHFRTRCNQVIVEHQQLVGRLLAGYFEISGRIPIMPAEELAASVFTLGKGIALARQTRPSTKPASTRLIKILLSVPAEISAP